MPSFIPKYDPLLFSEIHKVPTFLPPDEIEDSIRTALNVAGVLIVIHLVLLQVVKSWMLSGKGKGGGKSVDDDAEFSLAAWNVSFQLMKFFLNLTFGFVGIYYTINLPWNEDTFDKIVGYEHTKLFAVGQVGNQLWALIIGLFFLGEVKSMIMHHVAVICVASVSAFLHCGFRYYIPYFYGLIEISSVPLSVMNTFKKDKQLIKAYPNVYQAARLVFSATFLIVRVIMWTPIFWDFFTNSMMLLYSSESMTAKVILACFNLSSLILSILQYFWASKVIVGLVKLVRPREKKVLKFGDRQKMMKQTY